MHCWERQLCVDNLLTPSCPHKNKGLGTEQILTERQSSYCVLSISFCVGMFPCVRRNMYSFVRLECVSHSTWPVPALYLRPAGRGCSPSFSGTEGVRQGPCPVSAARKGSLALRVLYPQLKLILLFSV